MSGSLNKVLLIGNLGKDPEIRSTNDGREVANLVVATNESWTDKNSGERKEKTEWHRIACFNPGLINVIRNYLKKGSKVFIEGHLQTRKWQDQSGQDKYSTEIVLQGYNCNLTMLDRPANSNSGDYSEKSQGRGAPAENSSSSGEHLNDDIPF